MPEQHQQLAEILKARRADPSLPGWREGAVPTATEKHADDIINGVIRVNENRIGRGYAVLLPCEEISGRWLTVDAFASQDVAEAFAAGYCTRRDQRVGQPPVAVASPRRLSLLR